MKNRKASRFDSIFLFTKGPIKTIVKISKSPGMSMIYPLGCLAFWVYGFAIGWGNWWNGPVGPGWYPSLGPGLSLLNEGWGLGAAVDAAGKATGAFTYGLIGLKGWFLTGAVGDTAVLVLFFFMMHLRKKIEISDAPHRMLKTESGIGYRLVMPSSNP